MYALASDIHLSIAFLAAFFVLESLDGNTIKIILEVIGPVIVRFDV